RAEPPGESLARAPPRCAREYPVLSCAASLSIRPPSSPLLRASALTHNPWHRLSPKTFAPLPKEMTRHAPCHLVVASRQTPRLTSGARGSGSRLSPGPTAPGSGRLATRTRHSLSPSLALPTNIHPAP